ncbi:MAG: hypothetical protein WC518_03475 [Patescibacteria group bacterium]
MNWQVDEKKKKYKGLSLDACYYRRESQQIIRVIGRSGALVSPAGIDVFVLNSDTGELVQGQVPLKDFGRRVRGKQLDQMEKRLSQSLRAFFDISVSQR